MFVVELEHRQQIELRRSARLQESNYYGADRRPVISYKETPYKFFKRRRGHLAAPITKPQEVKEEKHIPQKTSKQCVTFRIRGFWPFAFLLFLITCMTISHVHYSVRREENEIDDLTRLQSTEADLRPNYALPFDGAKVLPHRSSESYQPKSWSQRLHLWLCPKQSFVIQPSSPLIPGVCWAFPGGYGHLQIQLSEAIRITHITIGHIMKNQSPTGQTTSAPRQFSVFGMKTIDGEKKLLGSFTYEQDGPSFQTFAFPDQDQETYQHVKLEFNSNWGNVDYTCLYNVRVHGEVEGVAVPEGVAALKACQTPAL